MTNEKKSTKLKDLFIEDLGQVTGGKGPYTTLAIGEEDPTTSKQLFEEMEASTMAYGEEDMATTMAIGEEDDGGGI